MINEMQLPASPANPLARQWSQLDFQARRDVVREREQELREMQRSILMESPHGATGTAPRVVSDNVARGEAKYDAARPLDEANFDRAFDNAVNQAGGAREPGPEEFQKREHGSHEKLLSAFTQFLALPSTNRGRLVQLLMDDYQTTWMTGRKRVFVSE